MNIIRPKTRTQWFGSVDEGKQLEIVFDEDGKQYMAARIIADESDEQPIMEIQVDGRLVQIPVAEIEEFIRISHGRIHSESWYEKNVYPAPDEND